MSVRKTYACAMLIASVFVLGGCGGDGNGDDATASNPVIPHYPPATGDNPPPVVQTPPPSSSGDSNDPPPPPVVQDPGSDGAGDPQPPPSVVQNPGSGDGATAQPANAVELVWAPPTVNVDGTPVESLAGYRVLYGRDVENLEHSLLIEDPDIHECVLENLQKGTWYFAIVARNALGLEGPRSNIASKTII